MANHGPQAVSVDGGGGGSREQGSSCERKRQSGEHLFHCGCT